MENKQQKRRPYVKPSADLMALNVHEYIAFSLPFEDESLYHDDAFDGEDIVIGDETTGE